MELSGADRSLVGGCRERVAHDEAGEEEHPFSREHAGGGRPSSLVLSPGDQSCSEKTNDGDDGEEQLPAEGASWVRPELHGGPNAQTHDEDDWYKRHSAADDGERGRLP